jgi:predicted S18 family serine protease
MIKSLKSKLLTFLLALSLVANAYFIISFEEQTYNDKGQVQEMKTTLNNLKKENENLQAQINQANQSLNSYAPQLDSYRERVFELENNYETHSTSLKGFATLQGPAVMQAVQSDPTDPFGRQSVTEKGTLINMSVEIQPGKGRVLVQTTPLMGVVFQDAANTAVFVAEKSNCGRPPQPKGWGMQGPPAVILELFSVL